MSISEQTTMMVNRVQNIRNKFHPQMDHENGIYLSYGRTTGGIKGGIKKIMELLKIPNLSSITTKINNNGGIDIIKLDFNPTASEEAQSDKNHVRKKP